MTIKFAIRIGYKDVLMTAEQLESVLATLSDSEVLEENHEKGDDGKYFTVYTLGDKFNINKQSQSRIITEDEYNSIKFITAARKTA
jgi:hypothetical protein